MAWRGVLGGGLLGLAWLTLSWAWALVASGVMVIAGFVSFALWIEQFTRNYGPPTGDV